ncbi:tetraacyldisaccharide 4'-kinase [Cellvibrio sp. OA-2007]|uniref:tetraacyldisaccharide 4'-kinase n=1 Tax=Cellvibrio sp. OA-2007 TaxID=529823 RepID=UPI000780B6F6|nr:tetraacyldisaccharide 4'-kinase [Cellvibrio sp. OA-2007]
MSSPDKQAPASSASAHSQSPWLAAWYGKRRWTLLLMPLLGIFVLLANLRRYWFERYTQKRLVTPVIVVGNISVGGTGKTPLLIALVKWLQQQGFNPGVISRGYGGKASHYPYLLNAQSTAAEAGDEPVTIYQQTGCAVCVGPDRVAAARVLEDENCDILLSDDGLQHYRLGRDIEIAVVDGQRGLGNGWRLPVGPLREPKSRLKTVDWVVVNSPTDDFVLPGLVDLFYVPMRICAQDFINLKSSEKVSLNELSSVQVNAVAGIGNPQRFHNTLTELGLTAKLHSFPDHHIYSEQDFQLANHLPLVMTEKDAVKCRDFAQPNWFYLPITASLPDSFWQALQQKLERICMQKKSIFKSK